MQQDPCVDDTAVQSQRDVLLCLSEIEHRTAGNKNNIVFLKQFLQSPQLSSLFKIYDRLNYGNTHCLTFTTNAQDVIHDICNILTLKPYLSEEARELGRICHNPHFQGLIASHDQITNKLYEKPMQNELDDDSDEVADSVRIVRLVKQEQQPLGITVRHCHSKGCCLITRIMDGGTASRSGVVEVGDKIYEINGVSLKGKRIEDILTLLHFSTNSVSLKIIPVMDNIRIFPRENKIFHIKSHFAYNPRDDPLLPCQEAGLSFGRNDILHVFDKTDVMWWQARKDGGYLGEAGLIPSEIMQERRLYKENLENALNKCFQKKKCPSFFKSNKKFKKKKIMYSSDYTDDFEAASMRTYEEVVEITPARDTPRPVVLIGPRYVGRNELRRLLISSDPERFITPVNYPSRKQFDHDNKNFFYTDNNNDVTFATCRSFTIEHKGDFERISIESVRTFMNSGKCCVLVVPPQELPVIRTRELLPYVIFIKPPSLQRLRQTRLMSRVKISSLQNQNRKVFTLTELQEMLQRAEEIERKYGQYFDFTILNDDLHDAYDRLYTAAYLLAKESQWFPVSWLT